jgi:NADH-quinone oxidoreductase subunit M
MIDANLLSWIVFVPALGTLLLAALPAGARGTLRRTAVAISAVPFLLALRAWWMFDAADGGFQFVEQTEWLPRFGISYFVGVDGISLLLVLLTVFLTPLVLYAAEDSIHERLKGYLVSVLLLESAMLGTLVALDLILFYVFWELMLVPMFLIIGVWGGERRVYATIKFFLYTFLGSVLMLVAFIYLYGKTGGFDLFGFMNVSLSLTAQKLIFIAFLAAFAVKVPMWPVHTWLPDAHVEAPTGGSVVLAAIMLKMGGYGFIRLSLPIVPDGSAYFADLVIALSLIAVVYIGFVALMQKDMKKLIAYSSIAHMGFVTLGFFLVWSISSSTGAGLGLTGGMVQMISHGLISGAMFLCVGVLYDRVHSRQIGDYGGVANTMPTFAAFMVLFSMANAGLPGTSGFVGEFMVIIASFKANFWYAFLAATTLVLGAAYTLWMVKRVLYGEVANDKVAELEDLNSREFIVLGILAISVLLVGLWPAPLVDMMNASIEQLLAQVAQSKL